jgi:hypothetical protein
VGQGRKEEGREERGKIKTSSQSFIYSESVLDLCSEARLPVPMTVPCSIVPFSFTYTVLDIWKLI